MLAMENMRGMKEVVSQAPVPHTCNPGYFGDWDWENRGLKPAQEGGSPDPVSKMTSAK
jgi:hypothetical protein